MLDRYDQDLLLDYLEGELDADRRAQLEAMLADDPQLAVLLEQMAQDREALRSVPRAETPADLTVDVTQALERRMLLDEQLPATEPIPIARGRGLPGESTGGLHWGRIAGLSALAASVALAAGIVVITLDQNNDPLMRTADNLASSGEEQPKAGDTGAEGSADDEEAAERGDAGPDAESFGGADDATVPDPQGQPELEADALARRGAPAPEPIAARGGGGTDRDTIPRVVQPGIPPTTQPAVALAVTEPRRQLVLYTDQVELTREQLIAYCLDNSIPIVQNDRALNLRVNEEDPAHRDDAEVLANTTNNDYALLIDEVRLDSLVNGFNGTIAPGDGFDPRLSLSNQAALVTDFPPQPAQAAFVDDPVEASPPAERIDTPVQQLDEQTQDTNTNAVQQQPIELRLPEDLGSPTANSQNRGNFNAEQRRGTYQQRSQQATNHAEPAPTADLRPAAGDTGEADQTTNDAPGNLALTERERAAVQNDEGESRERSPSDPSEDPTPQAGFAAGGQADHASADAVPLRSNWLAPHLPMARVTPILNWTRNDPTRPPQLVPILIKAAPSERVNSLRREQQAIYSRVDKPDTNDQANEAGPAEERAADPDIDATDPAREAGDAPVESTE